jgi:hypothetical protein
MLRKLVEPNALEGRGLINADEQASLVHFAPCGLLVREIPHEADGQGVLHPPAVRTRDPEAQHPDLTILTAHFLQTSSLIGHVRLVSAGTANNRMIPPCVLSWTERPGVSVIDGNSKLGQPEHPRLTAVAGTECIGSGDSPSGKRKQEAAFHGKKARRLVG